MRQSYVLDPLWITKGTYLDPEYFSYILLDASLKYREDIEKRDLSRFNEVLFHSLNMTTLATGGGIYTAKMRSVWDTPRINQIRKDLSVIYEKSSDSLEIVRNANYVFMRTLLDYLHLAVEVIHKAKIAYSNQLFHRSQDVYVIINSIKTSKYSIWKHSEGRNKMFGSSFKKEKTLNIENLAGKTINDHIASLNDPDLADFNTEKNACLVLIEDYMNEKQVAMAMNCVIILNKLISKKEPFDVHMINEVYAYLWKEKTFPFTVNDLIETDEATSEETNI